jgi:uncharacterized glyoxalase superfamily protein PhnB
MEFTGVVVGTKYEDANGMLDWLARVFGFRERARYVDKDGKVIQAEMLIGDTELWFSGHEPGSLWGDGKADQFVGVWVDDVDAMHRRVTAAGVEAEAPVDRDYDVRSFNVTDPEGYLWGFMKRLGKGYVQRIPTEEGGLEEILPPTPSEA